MIRLVASLLGLALGTICLWGASTSAGAQSGHVSIALDASAYSLGKPITATVHNNLGRTIYADDEKSDCSIVFLERHTGTGWQTMRGCALRRVALTVAIPPGGTHPITINPLSVHFGVRPGSTEPAFGAGRYRLTLLYRFERPFAREQHTAHSRTFAITGS